MSYSEKLCKFNEKRVELNPYGLTCELWTPSVMTKPDRHNEIELNYFPEGSITYLFHGHKVTIPAKRLALFWGLIPHQIISYERGTPYYVCTIPFSQFLAWKLPTSFVDRILKGEGVVETSDYFSSYDEFMMKNWLNDINYSNNTDLILMEMHTRLQRMAMNIQAENKGLSIQRHEFSLVEQIAIYIAQNYSNLINVSEIGKAVGLHPDYANAIFKKTFGCTLYGYIVQERITHAQRKLILSDASVTEIAFECGFNSISRFNAAFLKINQCTPREYRKRYFPS